MGDRRHLRRLRRGLRSAAVAAFAPRPPPEAPLPDLRCLRRVLLVLLSQRLGNTILATPAVSALCGALPDAEIDFVGGPYAPAVLAGHGLGRIHVVRRADAWRPRRLRRLLGEIRARPYEAAIHLGTATGSLGALLTGASGAAHRIGCGRPGRRHHFTTALRPPGERHELDQTRAYLARLGIDVPARRELRLAPDERRRAGDFFAQRLGQDRAPFGFFVGARTRKGKDWSLANFGTVAAGLRARSLPVAVFLGPEETRRERAIRRALGDALFVREDDVRRVGALLSCCRAVLTPDTGPMHLAIAAGASTLAVFCVPNFDRWGPRPPEGEVLFDPERSGADEALERLLRLGGLS